MFILAATRTPFCKINSELSTLTAADLGRTAVSSLLLKTGLDPAEISEVIFGSAFPPLDTPNIARAIALRSGIPAEIPAMSVQRNCATGLEALTTAHQRILAQQGQLFLIGATESMSHLPLLFPHEAAVHFEELNRAKSSGQKISAAANFHLSDFRPKIGLEIVQRDAFSGKTIQQNSEQITRTTRISQQAQNDFETNSHAKAQASRNALNQEISTVFANGTAIQNDSNFSTTPANHADGAVAFLVGTKEIAQKLNLKPLGKINSYAYSGSGAINAIDKLKQTSHLTPSHADLIEIHEASAAQTLSIISSLRNLGSEIPDEIINRRGGSLALGHPTAATTARMVLTALAQLHETSSQRALITTPTLDGQGAALYLEKA